MLLVPVTVVHTGEVLVPEPGTAGVWRTAGQARAIALRRAGEDEAAVEAVADSLRLRGIPRPVEESLLAFLGEQGALTAGGSGSATEIDVDGEKLMYILEVEEGPEQPRVGRAGAGGAAPSMRSAEEAGAWAAFEVRMAALEAAECAAVPPSMPKSALRKAASPAAPPAAAPVPAAAHRQSVEMGPVREVEIASLRPVEGGGIVGLHAPPPPQDGSTRPVSRFKSGRPAREVQF
jgi:hypothetical protein